MIIVITGPTGIGKTKLSIALAKKYHAEIINGDSMQIYKGMNIGTAKITDEEKENIPHHLFDIKEIWENYSIYDYQKDCRHQIEEINKRCKNIIIVGGTGLYIKSALYDYTLDSEINNDQYEDISTEKLYQELIKLDKSIEIDAHNRRRVVRALNYYKHNHKSISDNKNGNTLLYNAIFIGLTIEDRNKLYKIIDDRVDKMIDNGLLDEVKSFYDRGYNYRSLNTAIGYKELYQYFNHKITEEEAIDLIKRNSRRYAKRQYTFFRNQFDIRWFNVNLDNFNKTINEIIDYLDKLLCK